MMTAVGTTDCERGTTENVPIAIEGSSQRREWREALVKDSIQKERVTDQEVSKWLK